MRIYRIRRHRGHTDGPHTYFHADVYARNWWSALRAAKQGRVLNWRWIDTFDRSDTTYVWYEFLYRVDPESARRPDRPLTHRAYREHKRKMRLRRQAQERRLAGRAATETRKAA
jgi:hypothetical protein